MRDVELVMVPETFIGDYVVQLNNKNKDFIEGFIELKGSSIANKKIILPIPELKLKQELVTNSEGIATVKAEVKKLNYWSPNEPHLYDVTLFAESDTLHDRIGFRTIRTEGQHIVLNDEDVFLKGICIDEESPFDGNRAHTEEGAGQLLTWAKELGCNYVRLAHYPHNEHMIRLADQMLILVWAEIPVYWTIN